MENTPQNNKEQPDKPQKNTEVHVGERGVNVERDATAPIITGDNNRIEQTITYIQQLPKWLIGVIVAGLLTLIVGISTIIWYVIPETEMEMVGDFRIAVAQMQWSGGEEPDSISKSLSEGVALNLQQLIEEINLPFVITLWGPDQVGPIEGNNQDERAESAAEIAQKIKADIVVYGVIDSSNSIWEIQPEFYISDRSENLSDAQEITGEHAIGHPFNAPGGDIAGRITLSENLRERTELLSQIVLGVAFYSARNYPRALEFFESIENAEVWDSVGGKELLYLLIGNAAGKDGQTAKAETSYLRAQAINPDYARAYAGLGSVRYIQALEPIRQDDGSEDVTKVDVDLLVESLAQFSLAQNASVKPALADIDAKVHFGRGQAFFMLWLSPSDTGISMDDIIYEFEFVIAEYGDIEQPDNSRIRDLAAESFGRLGLMYLIHGDEQEAIRNYENAVEILEFDPDRQKVYQDRLDQIRQDSSEN